MIKSVIAASCLALTLALAGCGASRVIQSPTAQFVRHAPVAAQTPFIAPVQAGALMSVVSYATVAAVLNGQLEITTDAGARWRTATLPRKTFYTALDFVSPTTGWLLAFSSTRPGRPFLYKTGNGGRTWHEELRGSPSSDGGTLDMVSAEDGWAVISSTLYHTTDGGHRWTPVALPPGYIPDQLDFVSDGQGWISTQSQSSSPQSSILATSDGVHFHTILSSTNAIAAINLQSGGHGYVIEASLSQGPQFGSLVTTNNKGYGNDS